MLKKISLDPPNFFTFRKTDKSKFKEYTTIDIQLKKSNINLKLTIQYKCNYKILDKQFFDIIITNYTIYK